MREQLAAVDRPLEAGAVRVLADVSSMSRLRMAAIIDAARIMQSDVSICIDFVYSIAKYSRPPRTVAPITAFRAVTAPFAGWQLDPNTPTCAVIGVGYEQDQVIGVVEKFEPAECWTLIPSGPDERYMKSVQKANDTLWEEVPAERRLIYDVVNPFSTFLQLESLVFGVLRDSRPVLIPFGPKIFTVASLLVGAVHAPSVPVWRVSCDQADEARNRAPSGHLTGLRAHFHRPLCDCSDLCDA